MAAEHEIKDYGMTNKAHCHPPHPHYNLEELLLWSIKHDWGEGSDTHRWAPVLYALAKTCNHITEFGVDSGISTGALLASNPSKVFHAYDIKRLECVDALEEIAKREKVPFVFHQISTTAIDPIDETDLLFIDTLHTYDQLSAELRIHASRVKKYICFHDTVGFAVNGELPGSRGLIPAINELITDTRQWQVLLHYQYGCGFTVLERIKPGEE